MVIPGLPSSDALVRILDRVGWSTNLRVGAYAGELARYPPLSTPTVGVAVTSGRADAPLSFLLPPPTHARAPHTGEHEGLHFPECNTRRFRIPLPRLPQMFQSHLMGREVAPAYYLCLIAWIVSRGSHILVFGTKTDTHTCRVLVRRSWGKGIMLLRLASNLLYRCSWP